uniref:Origin recognition complex subunit 4 C-terminal domain-containing protein n=1 Tax=Chloropicon laureae TaxID=464258 RepID=A0A7S2Z412_9CHLO
MAPGLRKKAQQQVEKRKAILRFLRRQLLNEGRGESCRATESRSVEAAAALERLIRATIEHGTNNSVLLVGAPGSGKKEVLQQVLDRLLEEFNEGGKSATVGVVRLSGLLHSDECGAMREIARQVCATWGLSFLKSASFSTNLRFLREILSELDKGDKTVIFVLDCLDLYTSKQKQGLLYNLLDALQGSQTQAAVVGVSNRHDCVELMEKRARSRFSYRKVVMAAPPAEEGMRVLKDLLCVPEGAPRGLFEGGEADRFNEEVAAMLASAEARAVLDRFFKCNATIHAVEQLVLGLICSMDSAARGSEGETDSGDGSGSGLTLSMLKACCGSMSVTTFMKQALQMPILDLILLVAMQRLEMKGKKSYNFHHIYEEYQQMLAMNATRLANLSFGQEAALESYSRLLDQKFLMLTDTRRYVQQEFRLASLLMMGIDLEETISRHPNCPEVLRQWLFRKNVHTR